MMRPESLKSTSRSSDRHQSLSRSSLQASGKYEVVLNERSRPIPGWSANSAIALPATLMRPDTPNATRTNGRWTRRSTYTPIFGGGEWARLCTHRCSASWQHKAITTRMPALHCLILAALGCTNRSGFVVSAFYREVGYKMEAWHDVGYWELALQPKPPVPRSPLSLAEIRRDPSWHEMLISGLSLLRSFQGTT